MMKLTRSKQVFLATGAAVILVSSCAALQGLDAGSTCADWNDATAEQQNSVVLDLVRDASDGARNPLRETNALFQISSVCASGNDDLRLGDISI